MSSGAENADAGYVDGMSQVTRSGRIAAYLKSLEPFSDEALNRLRDEAEQNGVPIIRPETESFLRTMIKITQPARILEIGTAVGYSSIVMAKAGGAWIDTIENYEKRISAARVNFKAAGLEDRIKLIEGDAGKVLKELLQGRLPKDTGPASGPRAVYDFVFLDAAKGQYLTWLPDILELMRPGAVLVADNVLQDETVAESRFTIPRRERTTHARMREFLYEIKHHPRLVSCVLPVGDGVSLSILL